MAQDPEGTAPLAVDTQNLGLLDDGKVVLLDYRHFAPDMPALKGALEKKSYSSVKSLVLAWNVLISKAGLQTQARSS